MGEEAVDRSQRARHGAGALNGFIAAFEVCFGSMFSLAGLSTVLFPDPALNAAYGEAIVQFVGLAHLFIGAGFLWFGRRRYLRHQRTVKRELGRELSRE